MIVHGSRRSAKTSHKLAWRVGFSFCRWSWRCPHHWRQWSHFCVRCVTDLTNPDAKPEQNPNYLNEHAR